MEINDKINLLKVAKAAKLRKFSLACISCFNKLKLDYSAINDVFNLLETN